MNALMLVINISLVITDHKQNGRRTHMYVIGIIVSVLPEIVFVLYNRPVSINLKAT